MTAHERWEPISGWPHYEINTRTGAVRSLDHVDALGRHWRGRLLRISEPRRGAPARRAGGGGPRCTLSHGGRRRTFYPVTYLESTQQRGTARCASTTPTPTGGKKAGQKQAGPT